VFKHEKETIFQWNWVYAARTDQLGEATGSYFSGVFLDNPFIILRGPDKKLRAFYNICSHHGAALIKPDEPCTGRKDKLVCCYHGWTFNFEGKLTKAVKLKGIENFVASEWGLKEIPVRTWGPFVFIWFGDPKVKPPTDLHAELHPFNQWLETFGYPSIDQPLKYVAEQSFEIACNWKLVNDNYLDGVYHIPTIHHGLNSALTMESYQLHNYPKLMVQVAASRNLETTPFEGFQDRYGVGPVYAVYYPTFALNRYGDVLESNVLIPLSHDRTQLKTEYFVPPALANNAEFIARTLNASTVVQNEDTGICELLQRNMRSRGYVPGRYSPSMEGATYHFHKLVARDLSV
jgi:choline monooxygenase